MNLDFLDDTFLDLIAAGDDVSVYGPYGIYPVNAPGMPAVGMDVTECVQEKAGTDPVDASRELYRMLLWALFSKTFSMPVTFKTKRQLMPFVPGHHWGSPEHVGPRGHCRVFVVGKQPGEEEVKKRLNFVGAPGDCFKKALDMVQIPWAEYMTWYLTNAVRHPHPSPKGGSLQARWYKDCNLMLEQELRLIRPEVILCLGQEAAQAVLGEKIGMKQLTGDIRVRRIDCRRTEHDPPLIHEAKVVTAVHPGYILRRPDKEPELLSALRLLKAVLNKEQLNSSETLRDHRVVYSVEELRAIIDQILCEPDNLNIALDGEWQGEFPEEPGAYLRSVQFSHRPYFACSVALTHPGGQPAFLPNRAAAFTELKRLVHRPGVRAIGHFLRADMPWLEYNGLDVSAQFAMPASDPEWEKGIGLPGWEKTRTEGGFDTGLALHAVEETADFKLEVACSRLLGLYRYDRDLQDWKKKYCAKLKRKEETLEGYGECPDEILHPYGCYDADATQRLFRYLNSPRGLLDADRFGNCSRKPFWISMQASPAFAEMERVGLQLDVQRVEELTELFLQGMRTREASLREWANWPNFNFRSKQQCSELLFGERFNEKIDPVTKAPAVLRPEGAKTLGLTPVKTTGKRSVSWDKVEQRNEFHLYSPSTDAETLGILSAECEQARWLRDVRFLDQVVKTLLKPPKTDKDDEVVYDEEGLPVYPGGIMHFLTSAQKIRTHFYQTKETGRASSARPPLQNISKQREADYKRILGDLYQHSLRSIFLAEPGKVLLEADYSGAELFVTAIMAQDPVMLDHCERSKLPEDHPDYVDIHSNMTVQAFQLDCPATKAGLKSLNKGHLRNSAKAVIFGSMYGRGAEAIWRELRELGVAVTLEEVEKLQEALFTVYARLPDFFGSCQAASREPGWLATCFGRFRRFGYSPDERVMKDQERSAMNFPIQGGVADAVQLALANMLEMRGPRRLPGGPWFEIVLQIHDAIILQVEPQHVEWAYEQVIPACMENGVEIWPCLANGARIPGAPSYRLGAGRELFCRWGENLSKAECVAMGIPEKYGVGK